jgi:hypothetical protein
MLLSLAQDMPLLERAVALQRADQREAALHEVDGALALQESLAGRSIRAQILLSLGRYQEGFRDFQCRWNLYSHIITPAHRESLERFPRWHGEDLAGKRIALVHEQGFGDTIMMLRFVPQLQAMGADVVLVMPPPLQHLAAQLAPIAETVERADYALPMFDLPMVLGTTPASVPPPPYLKASAVPSIRFLVGIAWSSSSTKVPTDINREIELGRLLELLDLKNGELLSLQSHGAEQACVHGVTTLDYAHFADLAHAINLCDTVIAIDTAALHLAGALGHPDTYALLPFCCSWRWRNGNPWYPQIKLCRQSAEGDWASAVAQVN